MVKSIFKIIIGTAVIMVVAALIIEYVNLTLAAPRIQDITKMSIKQACNYYGQETYKRDDADNVDAHTIISNVGTNAVSGKFYNGSTKDAIYENLYKNSAEFKDWAREFSGNWEDLDILYNGIMGYELGSNEQKLFSKFYNEYKMTPMNVGVTYIDRQTIERIARWNLVSTISDGIQANIIGDDGSEGYVRFKGFKIYYNRFHITDIEYKIYDLNDVDDKQDFEKLTNIDADKLSLDGDERSTICIAGISYELPLEYEGVTYMHSAIAFAWDTEVEGYNGQYERQVSNNFNLAAAESGSKTTLAGGGFDGNTALPVAGEIMYYIVR